MISLFIKAYCLIRFGRVVEVPKEYVEGHLGEFEVRGRRGGVVGYFAYGYYDPSLPFGEKCAKHARYRSATGGAA